MNFLKTIFTKNFWKESSKYLLSLFFITLFIIIGLFFKTYFDSKNELKEDLTKRIDLISKAVRPVELDNLNASSLDLEKREYKDLKFKLESLRSVSSDLRFLYITKEIEGKIYFVVDSEPDYSPDVSFAGDQYDEAPNVLIDYSKTTVRDTAASTIITDAYSDRWGKWISVYAPVRDSTGRFFVVGADLDYAKAIEPVIANFLILSLISIFLLTLILGVMYISHEEREVLKNKTAFISLASHELRAPMTGIMWTIENLLTEKSLDPDHRASLKAVHGTTRNLIALVNDFLNYVTLDNEVKKMDWKNVEVVDLLNTSIETLKDLADVRNIKIQKEGFEDFGKSLVFADKSKLSSAFNNLISNAIKYSKDNGNVIIKVSGFESSIVILFKDEGIGIKKADQTKIFQGMYRTEEAKEHTVQGTGLGLNFVKKIVLMHKGSIDLSSEIGKGTEVKVIIPLNKNNLS